MSGNQAFLNQFPTIEGQEDVEPDEVALANALAALGDGTDASVSIYRQGPGGYRDMIYLTECLPAEFSLSRLQDEFEGGNFRIHIRSEGKLLRNQAVKVAPLRKKQDIDFGAGLAPVNEKINQLAGLVEKMATAMATPPAQSRKEMLEELLLYKDLFASAPRQVSAVDPVESTLKIIAVAKELGGLGGAGEGGTDSLSVIMKAIETFGAPMAQMMARNQALAQQQQLQEESSPMLQQPVPEQPGAASEINQLTAALVPEQQIGEQEAMRQFDMFMTMCMMKARMNSDPTGSAYLIVENAPPETIRELLQVADWWEKLVQIKPEVGPFKEWFSELRETVLELLTEQDGEGTNGEISPGAPPHVPS